MFCRQKGQGIKTFWKRWRTACEAAGCPGRIPHDFRRTAVRNLDRAGVPETVAMKITGHKTRSVSDRYDITSEEDLAEASSKLQVLAGTISGTNAVSDAEALVERLSESVNLEGKNGGQGQNRTGDTTIFSRMLYQLSYLATREGRAAQRERSGRWQRRLFYHAVRPRQRRTGRRHVERSHDHLGRDEGSRGSRSRPRSTSARETCYAAGGGSMPPHRFMVPSSSRPHALR